MMTNNKRARVSQSIGMSHKSSLSSSTSSLASLENECTIYLGDLDEDFTERHLKDYFRSLNVPVVKVVKQRQSSFAHITLNDPATAKRLIGMANIFINGKPVRVMPFSQPNKFNPKANLIIKNLESNVNESDLMHKFEEFGKILSCKVARHKPSGESKCYAFVQYENEEDAAMAIDRLNNSYWLEECDPDVRYKRFVESKNRGLISDETEYDSIVPIHVHGKKIYVGLFMSKDEYSRVKQDKDGKQSNLYVSGFGSKFGDRDLYDLFKQYGRIKSAKVRREKRVNVEVPLGCGFVDFEFPEDAETARLSVDGITINGRPITVKYADCKSRKMRKKLEIEEEIAAAAKTSEDAMMIQMSSDESGRNSYSSSQCQCIFDIHESCSNPVCYGFNINNMSSQNSAFDVDVASRPSSIGSSQQTSSDQEQSIQTSIDQDKDEMTSRCIQSNSSLDVWSASASEHEEDDENELFVPTLLTSARLSNVNNTINARMYDDMSLAFLPNNEPITDWVSNLNKKLGPYWEEYKLFNGMNYFD